MAGQQVGEIRINPRTVRIGHQVYPPANISRVQTVQVRWTGKWATSYPVKKLALWTVLLAVAAIEHPPTHERVVHLHGDLVVGDQFKQTGNDARMPVNNHLTRAGAVGPDGTVTDPAAVVTEVESNKARLNTLGKAVLGGAKDAVLAAVRNGAAALVVALPGRA